MQIIISNHSEKPIYEQIVDQFKRLILADELTSEMPLPSIRQLAKDLRISVITTKRAYEELEREGFIKTIPSKGSYVALKNRNLKEEELLKQAEQQLKKGIQLLKRCQKDKVECLELVAYLYEEENNESEY